MARSRFSFAARLELSIERGILPHFVRSAPPSRGRLFRSMSDPRPQVRRGDWFWTRHWHSRVVCKFYRYPPSRNWAERILRDIPPGTYLGPVHEVEETDLFTSIRIPTGERPDRLAWLNVWRAGDHRRPDRGVHYAFKVEDAGEWGEWHNRGWVNFYIDGQNPRQ